MKLIALDVGTKRIGVAKADSKVRIAIPYTAIEVNGGEFKKIASLARAWDIQNFVIGLPRSNEGNETKQSAYVRQFAQELKKSIPGARVCFQDESLTSVEAEKRLKSRKKAYAKGDIDSEAAAIILQDFIEEKTGKPTSRATSARHKTVKGVKKSHRGLAILITVVFFLVVAGAGGWMYYSYNLRPVSDITCSDSEVLTDSCDATVFAVETGTSISQVAESLKQEGLIRDPLVFRIHFHLSSHGETLKAGEYDLNKSMSVGEITDLLLKGGEKVFSFTVFPGSQISKIKTDLVAIGYSAEDVDAAFAKDYRSESFGWMFEGMPEDQHSLEGYLFGETYEFYAADSAEAVVRQFLSTMADVIEKHDFKSQFAAQGYNLYQGITLASVIQREANNAADMAKISQIFKNRLANDMTLGSDVTAIYAADLIDPDRLTYTDNAMIIDIDSPYNTRKNPGLPYGPISNPGLDALQAVATPDQSMQDMLFFLTGDDQMMYYSDTEEGHQQNIIDHCQQLCNISL